MAPDKNLFLRCKVSPYIYEIIPWWLVSKFCIFKGDEQFECYRCQVMTPCEISHGLPSVYIVAELYLLHSESIIFFNGFLYVLFYLFRPH